MTSTGAPPPGGGGGSGGSRGGHPGWRRSAEILTAVAGVATILTYLGLNVHARSGSSASTPSPVVSESTEGPPAPPSSSAASTAGVVPVGKCLTADAVPLPRCDVAHVSEVIGTGTCTAQQLVQYLGGDPEVDIVNVQPVPLMVGQQRVCAASTPDRQVASVSFRSVLQTPAGSAWRRCRDARVGADVPCSLIHTSEYVLVASSSEVDCSEAAARYLGAPMSRYGSQLQTDTIRLPTGPVCTVSARGADLLTDSLRNVGVHSLPLSS